MKALYEKSEISFVLAWIGAIFYMLSMLCVGFLEEMIFRGFLFYAMATGFLFVMIFYKTKSLIPCILIHGVFNALSVFANEEAMTPQKNVISCLFMVVVCGTYAWYMTLKIKKCENK